MTKILPALLTLAALAGCTNHHPAAESCEDLPLVGSRGREWVAEDGRRYQLRDPEGLYTWAEIRDLGCEQAVTCQHFPFAPHQEGEGECINPRVTIQRALPGSVVSIECDGGQVIQMESPCGCGEPWGTVDNEAIVCAGGTAWLASELIEAVQ